MNARPASGIARETHPPMFREVVSLPGLFAKKAPVRAAHLNLDEATFCALYKSVAPALQGYIRKACGNAALAEDILQETFYRFLRASLPPMDSGRIKSYLFKIATSLLVDQWRREKREKFRQSLWRASETSSDQRSGDVAQALSALKPRERALLWLAYAEGCTHAEIAAVLGIKEKSIRVLLFRARNKLARIMGRPPGAHGVIG